MTRRQQRGACPTLRVPMMTGDGLLARLRPVDDKISPDQLDGIATLAGQYGNGQIEITARGNLQVRGLRTPDVTDFATEVEALMAIDTGMAIEISPLSGLDPSEIADARPLATAIRTALAATNLRAALGPKIALILDGGGASGLGELAADVSLRAVLPDLWLVHVAGHSVGCVQPTNGAQVAMILLTMIADMGMGGRGRDLDLQIVRQNLKPYLSKRSGAPAPAPNIDTPIVLRDGRIAMAIGLPFGAASAPDLRAWAQAGAAAGIAEFRLGPHHKIIALCPSPEAAAQVQRVSADAGFLTDPADPRRSISACIGSDGCASGLLPGRRLAETLARAEPEFFDGSFVLHVSGCAKGCANPGATLLTLVGTNTDTGLVIEGNAKSDARLFLPSDMTPVTIHRLAKLWRDERKLGESVAACFKRLGAARVVAALQGQQ